MERHLFATPGITPHDGSADDALAIKADLPDAGPVTEPEEPEKDQEDDQNGHGDDESVAGWVFSLARQDQVEQTEPDIGQPLIEAQRAGRPVYVVSKAVIADWTSTQAAAAWAEVADNGDIGFSICAIDLAKTLEDAGLTGKTPENVLVIEDSDGVQAGTHNRQLNIHHFKVERVRVCLGLDRALADHLAAEVATSAPRQPNSTGTLEGFDKVVIRNSRGVQVGNHNYQRNVFRHVVKGLEMSLTELLTGNQLARVVGKLRERRMGAARSELSGAVRRAFKRDASRLFDELPDVYNTASPHIPGRIVRGHGTFGDRNVRKSRERIGWVSMDRRSTEQLADDVIGDIPPKAQPAVTNPAPDWIPDWRNSPSYDKRPPTTPSYVGDPRVPPPSSAQEGLPPVDPPEEPDLGNHGPNIGGLGLF